jgi:hypothetical protein
VGIVTLKSNGDEALNDEFLFKSNGDETFNASSLHRFIASLLHRCQQYIFPCRNRQKTGQNSPTLM